MAATTPEWWVTILTLALGGGGMAAILQTYRWWVDRKDKLNAEKLAQIFPQSLNESAQIYQELNRLLHAVDADQVLVLEAHNGGKIPMPGSKLKSSVIYEVYSADGTSVLNRWQNQPLDEAYTIMLNKVFTTEDHVRLIVEEMEDSTLKDVYVANGVYKSRVVRLRAEYDKYFYMSVVWNTKPSVKSAVITNEVRVTKGRLQTILEHRPKPGAST